MAGREGREGRSRPEDQREKDLRRAREIQVGATIVVALGLTLWGVTWLKEFSLANRTKVWHVTFPQTGGLSDSDEIRVNGLRKGAVSKVALVGDHVVVDLALDDDITLTSASRVAISNIGMMGEKVIAVSLSNAGVPLAPGDTITGIYEKGIAEVMSDMGTTVDAITRLALQVERIVAVTDQKGGLDQTVANFHRTSLELKMAVTENRALLNETLTNLNSASQTAKELTTDREDQLKRTIDSFERSATGMENLTVKLDSLRTSIQTVSNRVERGDGSLGMLVNDPKLYEETRASVAQFRALVEDIKRNPKKYVKLSLF
jgi:phospholipid/cholesterol/gamma-HCH transport system substrate-binding protein